jgi:hypothetical protein
LFSSRLEYSSISAAESERAARLASGGP